MTLRMVTPASGAPQLTINYDGGSSTVTSGQVLDVPVGSALETAIGTTNLTALTGTALANVQGGLDPTGTGNALGGLNHGAEPLRADGHGHRSGWHPGHCDGGS